MPRRTNPERDQHLATLAALWASLRSVLELLLPPSQGRLTPSSPPVQRGTSRNQHLVALSNIWFLLAGIVGLLLLLGLILGSFPGALALGFLVALLTAVGVRARWAAGRILAIFASIALLLGAIWLIWEDIIVQKRDNPSLDLGWYLQNPLVWFPILAGLAIGGYGLWTLITQWSTSQA